MNAGSGGTPTVVLALLTLLALTAGGARAQRTPLASRPVPPASGSVVPQGIVGGVAGSALGILAGGGLGLLVHGCGSGNDDCESVPAFFGALVGGVIGSALAGAIQEDGKVRTVGFAIGQGTLTGIVAGRR